MILFKSCYELLRGTERLKKFAEAEVAASSAWAAVEALLFPRASEEQVQLDRLPKQDCTPPYLFVPFREDEVTLHAP